MMIIKHVKFIGLLSGFLFLSASHAGAQAADKLTKAVEMLRLAMLDADSVQLNHLCAEKLSYGHSNGQVDDKKQFIGKLLNGSSDFVTLEFHEITYEVSRKVAVVRHQLQATTNDGGKPGEVKLRVLLIWHKQGGRWQLLARQAVRVS